MLDLSQQRLEFQGNPGISLEYPRIFWEFQSVFSYNGYRWLSLLSKDLNSKEILGFLWKILEFSEKTQVYSPIHRYRWMLLLSKDWNSKETLGFLAKIPGFSQKSQLHLVKVWYLTHSLSDHLVCLLTLMMLVASLANTKWCNKPEKWLKPWQMGTHLRVLSESFPMNTNMTGFRWFLKIFGLVRFVRK